MNTISIKKWEKKDEQIVTDLIVSIQSKEFDIPITAADQPDLKIVDKVYQKNKGNFWVAFSGDDVIGTIGLINYAPSQVALRKMFVRKNFRGKDHNVGQQLLQTALDWCSAQKLSDIYLGTTEIFKAARRFYEKNGFVSVHQDKLPADFPRMWPDKVFYHLKLML